MFDSIQEYLSILKRPSEPGFCGCPPIARCPGSGLPFFEVGLNLRRFSFDIRNEMKTLDRRGLSQDEWIALRCQSGEQNAFAALVALMERPLFYYAAKLTGNAETALDVLQDVWMKVFREIGRLKDPGSLRPWLYRVTHGMAVDRIRKHVSRERAEETHVAGFEASTDLSFTEDDAAAIHE